MNESFTAGFSLISAAGLILIGSGLILWFIVRRQKQRLWLPVLRVIDLELKVLPKLRWVMPPLWPLTCFLLSALALGLFLFEPSETVMKSDSLDLRPTHVFFDLSPSTSFGRTNAQYAASAAELLQAMSSQARISFSFSSDSKIYLASDIGSVSTLLTQQGFHRAGLRLGSAIDATLRRAPEIEHLIIVSDRDQGSWEDFNWHYLEKKIQVSWFPLEPAAINADNVFIDELKAKEGSGPKVWTLVLRRSGQGQALSGDIKVEFEGKLLTSQNWQFDAQSRSLELDISLPGDALDLSKLDDSSPLQWTLSLTGPQDLLIDNVFRTWPTGRGRQALLVAQPRGEMFLEDSVFHLRTSLDVLGFRTQRVDKMTITEAPALKPELVVSEVAPKAMRNDFCPLGAPTKAASSHLKDLQVWLMPSPDLDDYGELCYCFASLTRAPEELRERPAYCEGLETRDQYIGLLQSLGAKQIGGEIDSPLGALAMNFKNNALSLQILAFTLPLNPLQKGGVSFGQLPLLLRSILNFTDPGQSPGAQAGQWPRVEDITPQLGNETLDELVKMSNVPLVESLLREQALDQLPPKLELGSRGLVQQASLTSREQDARPWIFLFLSMLALAFWLESLGFLVGRLGRGSRWAARWFGSSLVLLACLAPGPVEGQVRLNALAYPALGSLAPLKRDISARTSIDFHEEALQFPQFERNLLNEPWIWSATPEPLENLDQPQWNELITWLQRGGFLIVEKHGGGERLKKRILEQVPQGAWKPIPPDHELMRSFHLLASLPQCGNLVWEGFHFDQRIAVVLIPGEFLRSLLSGQAVEPCFAKFPREQALRVFVNLLMVALATDYKKDQIHLPEILKRLR